MCVTSPSCRPSCFRQGNELGGKNANDPTTEQPDLFSPLPSLLIVSCPLLFLPMEYSIRNYHSYLMVIVTLLRLYCEPPDNFFLLRRCHLRFGLLIIWFIITVIFSQCWEFSMSKARRYAFVYWRYAFVYCLTH